MYQNYTSYYPQNQVRTIPQSTSSFGLKGRPVSSLEEARAMSIDFDGSVFYFPDLANRRIYTKQINLDGTATLNMYELKEIPTISNNSSNYITREEFESALSKIESSINAMAVAPVNPTGKQSIQQTEEPPAYLF